ncbi:hypothetical protein MKK75_21865 [Methylobacterium sp. J-030]|uniref:hypothetical protein n=1 Tax=Methylobacterium sp. J-030 TaxID=2836627 RepID=UPI001FBBD73D|nr:hypothetical protein [Methylobacterium sp. J-030]MCJ2071410.1 hypothetical protein [Methylobacterium sp. J-030]
MNIISWLVSKIIHFFLGRGAERGSSSLAKESETGAYGTQTLNKAGNFDADYRDASLMLKMRMGNRFPDNFHARVGSESKSVRDYGDERAGAIDTASATIAAALRNGATVRQAVEAGAASVGV